MPTHTMRAVRLHEHGGPEVLRYDKVPIPEPGPGEVLVRVHAIGINPPDWYLRGGLTTMPGDPESTVGLPVIPGTDVSGVVEAVAPDVHDLAVGDEVFGLLRFPSFKGSAYAEYVAAPASDLARKPAGIDHAHAAGAPMAGLTAWQFLIEVGHDHPSPSRRNRIARGHSTPTRRCSSTAPRAAWGTSQYSSRNGRARESSRWHPARTNRS